MTRDDSIRVCISSTNGSSNPAACASQSPSVDRATATPARDS
jgi:hypothetical protein